MSTIQGSELHEPVRWRCHTRLEKYRAGATAEGPFEVQEHEGNLLLLGGADVVWLGLKAGLSATTNQANTYFNNANAGIRVSTSNTAAASSQTNILGTTKFTMPMQATFPTHTTGTGTSTCSKILYKGVASSSQANFAWNEWCIVNRTAQTGGRALNRKVQSLGTKTSAAVWTFTVSLSLS